MARAPASAKARGRTTTTTARGATGAKAGAARGSARTRSAAGPPAAKNAATAGSKAGAARKPSNHPTAVRQASGADVPVEIRPVRPGDLAQVIAIDSIVTGLEKAGYWRTIHRRYGDAERAGRRFLVADAGGRVAGFVIGEVRDWEFGSPPCGWVFAIDVHPQFRLAGLGTRLVAALADWFRSEGVSTMRTILARDNTLILSFFRSLGMTTGPFIPLEIDLERPGLFPLDRERDR